MRKLFVFMMVSLDGYFEGENHDLSWHNVDVEFNAFASAQLAEVDTLVFGRKTYDLMASYWPTEMGKKDDPEVAAAMNTMNKIVASHTIDKVDWENTRLIKNNIAGEITELKSGEGKDMAIFGSSHLCVSLIEAGVIDEFRIMLSPVVLGKGSPLFGGIVNKLDLILVDTRTFASGNVLLTYVTKK